MVPGALFTAFVAAPRAAPAPTAPHATTAALSRLAANSLADAAQFLFFCVGSAPLTVFDPKRAAKQNCRPQPAATEGAMTLVAPQAAHAEAGVLLLLGLRQNRSFGTLLLLRLPLCTCSIL